MSLLLRNIAALVPEADARQVRRNVDMFVQDGRVVEIGPNLQVPAAQVVIDASDCIVYPGLVNTHHHFFQAMVRNRAGLVWPADVLGWIARIYPVFARLPAEAFFHASLVSMADLVKHGCTTAFDHQYCFPRGVTGELVDAQFEAAALVGMRFHAGRGANTLDEARGGVVPDALVESPEAFLRDCERLIGRYHDASPFAMRRVVVAPCQPANCTPASFADAAALARAHGVRLHTHLGEGENEVMRARTGMGSIDWCEAQGFAGRDVWVAHGWEFEPHELRQLAASGTGVAHCPMPVFLVGQRITDLVGMLDAGVRTGLGVDGQASNDSSNLLECIRSAYLLGTLAAGLYARRPPRPAELLHMATAGGADLLGCPELGRLAPGMAADFFAVDVSGIEHASTLHDPVSLPAKVGCTGPVKLTVIAGRVVWQDGAFTQFDEPTHARAARAFADSFEALAPEIR